MGEPSVSKTYDAVLVSETALDRAKSRLAAVCDIAEPLLGVGPGMCWVSRLTGPRAGYFCRAEPHDTLCFPANGPRDGEPRYDWADVAPGVQGGTRRD